MATKTTKTYLTLTAREKNSLLESFIPGFFCTAEYRLSSREYKRRKELQHDLVFVRTLFDLATRLDPQKGKEYKDEYDKLYAFVQKPDEEIWQEIKKSMREDYAIQLN